MIILTKSEADQIKGQYTEPYVLEPIYLGEDKYGITDAVMTNPAYREAWVFLKTKPVELITSDELESIVTPEPVNPDVPLYEIQGVELSFKIWEIRKISKERGEIKLTAIKNGLHRDINLQIDNEVKFNIDGVGELTAIQAMLFFDEQGMSSKAICEIMIPQREDYINENWFLKYE